jgi:hypothetical protein
MGREFPASSEFKLMGRKRHRRGRRKENPRREGWEITAEAVRAMEGRKGATTFDRLLVDKLQEQDQHVMRKAKGKRQRLSKRKRSVYAKVVAMLEQKRLERERQPASPPPDATGDTPPF